MFFLLFLLDDRRKEPDPKPNPNPDPYPDLDAGGPKTYESYGSGFGSATLLIS